MDLNSRLVEAERAILDAAPHQLTEALRGALTAYHTVDFELWLADYRATVLEPVVNEDAEAIQLLGTPQGDAFVNQRLVHRQQDGDTLYCAPTSVHGERKGVLAVTLPGAPETDIADEIAELGTVVARAIALAERVTDEYNLARRSRRLTLAAEIQWQLLPGCTVTCDDFALAGQLEPAYAVRGDNFDWTTDPTHITVAVTNGMGEGVTAALLTSLAINALRNARRAGLGLADQAVLADQAIWSQFGGEQHVSTLLMRLDRSNGEVEVVNAGSPSLWLMDGVGAARVDLEHQLPLGMFDSSVYTEQKFTIEPGSRLFVLSDGVSEAMHEHTRYGDEALKRIFTAIEGFSVAEAVRTLLADVIVFRGDRELEDDAVAVCVDWTGPV